MSNPGSPLSESTEPVESAPTGRFDFSFIRTILVLTLPIALGRQVENIMGMVNIFLVGKLGTEAISAYGIARSVTMVMSFAMMAVTTGTFALVAQAIGAGSMEDASATAKQSFTLLFLLSIGISLVGIPTAPYMLPALSVGPEVVALGTPYLQVYFVGIPLMMLNYAVTNCLHGAGDTRTPFYIGIMNNIVRIIATYLLIFGVWGLPRLGVTGAAYGDIIGRGVGTIAGFSVLYSGRLRLRLLPGTSYRPNLVLVRRILKIGIPSAVEGFLRNGSSLIYVKFVALTAFSTEAVAAFSIGRQIERVLHHTSLSFGTAATTLVGQSLGRKNPEEADRRGWTILLIAVLTTLIVGLPTVLFARSIMAVFTDAPQVIQIGSFYLYAIVLAEPFMGAARVSGGALRGAGDTMPALIYTLISQWCIRLPVAWVLAFWAGYDTNGIWAALIVFSVIQGFLTVRKYAQGEWKKRRI
ncbi:MAG: MATE family efflux transporter [bacterium]|nr:MATE family efflux transporter [bacterium]